MRKVAGQGLSEHPVRRLTQAARRGKLRIVPNAPDPRVVGLGVAIRTGAAEGAVKGKRDSGGQVENVPITHAGGATARRRATERYQRSLESPHHARTTFVYAAAPVTDEGA